MENVSLKLESSMARKIASVMKEFHYATKTEFIRDAIRDKLKKSEEEQQMKKTLAGVRKLYGSMKGKGRFKTDEEFLAWRNGKGGEEIFNKIEADIKAKKN